MLSFLSFLSDSPATGHVFIVSGKASSSGQQFTVSLNCGKPGSSDVSLLLLINYDGRISRTSLVNGAWSEYEDTANLTTQVANQIKRGDDFTIYVLVGDNRFHVSIDDESFCTYNFRVAPKEIRAVSVSGDIDSVTQMDHRLIFPSVYPLVVSDTPDLVFSGFVPRKFQPGQVIVVSGVASGNSHGEFVVFFCENDTQRQLIHMNPRFDQQEVVINTMLGDDDASWSDAEIHSQEFPFVLNQPFKLAMAFSESDFKVAVNGQHLMRFSLSNIELEDNQSLWDILTGFQIKVGLDLKVQVTQVEHVRANDTDCEGFENYSNLNAY